MATLNIGGTRVKVDDSFLTMTPEQQNAAVEEISKSLPAASQSAPAAPEPTSTIGKIGQAAEDIARLASNGVTFGFRDKLAHYLGGGSPEEERAKTAQAAERAGSAGKVAELGGAMATPIGMASNGLTLSRLIPEGAGLAERLILGTGLAGAEGGAYGGLAAAGHDQDIKKGMATGAAFGLGGNLVGEGIAAVAPIVKNAVQGALGIGNRERAKQAIVTALTRSGKTPEQITADMSQAATEGQGGYTLADALGNSGQRMLAGVARSPGDARQVIADTLEGRQAGQGRRVASFLDDAFGSQAGTALQKEAALSAERRAAGNANYGAARAAAGAVDTSPAIKAIDDVVAPGVTPLIGTGASDNSVYGTLNRVRSLLTNGKTQVSDFDRAFLAKKEMDAVIENGGTPAALLRPARQALDDALANASQPYAAARDAYRAQSRAIEAVDIGRNAARRGRFEDTVPAFNAMSATEKAGFRTGYADPLIEQVQGAAHGVNKARPLINDATAVEFPAFAGAGGEKLGRQLARENTMFETRGAALGGSKTADNLADMADVDPSVIAELIRHPISNGLRHVAGAVANAATGRNQAVREMIAKALLQSAGGDGSSFLTSAIAEGETAKRLAAAKRQAIVQALIGAGANATVAN
jgi:hypothetical protein